MAVEQIGKSLNVNDFVAGEKGQGLIDHLQGVVDETERVTSELENDGAQVQHDLHGPGKLTACELGVGSGLSVLLSTSGNGVFYVDGRRYEVAQNTIIGSVPDNATSHLYLDRQLNPTYLDVNTYPDPKASRPASTWYVGKVTASAGSVTSVDDSDADTVADIDSIRSTLDNHETRITSLEGGSQGGGVTQAQVDQTVSDAIAQHVSDMHQGGTADGVVDIERVPADLVVNYLQLVLNLTERYAPEAPDGQRNVLIDVDGVWGDGSFSSPNYRLGASTW